MNLARLIILCLFLVSSMSVNGQVTLIAPSQKANNGDLMSVEIKVKSRDTIAGLEFTLLWDPTVLSFQKVTNFNLTASSFDTFGLTNVSKGTLKLLWSGVDPFAIKDSMIVFKVNFKVEGSKGTSSPITFLNPKAFDNTLNAVPIPITVQNGVVMVNNGTSAVGNVSDTEGYAQLHQSQPNPANNKVLFPFTIKEADEVTLTIHDMVGKLIFTEKKRVGAGDQNFELNTEGVLAKGMFIYGIQTKKGFISRTFTKI
jgi:Cohesin domain/Secretion system C-terminal sorting domain